MVRRRGRNRDAVYLILIGYRTHVRRCGRSTRASHNGGGALLDRRRRRVEVAAAGLCRRRRRSMQEMENKTRNNSDRLKIVLSSCPMRDAKPDETVLR